MEVDEKQPDLSSWDDFAGEWLKADDIKKFPVSFVCLGVDAFIQDGKTRLVAEVELNGRKKKFDLNKSNQNIIKPKLKSPKELIGKKITCDKIKVRNPSTNSMVNSLIIDKLE